MSTKSWFIANWVSACIATSSFPSPHHTSNTTNWFFGCVAVRCCLQPCGFIMVYTPHEWVDICRYMIYRYHLISICLYHNSRTHSSWSDFNSVRLPELGQHRPKKNRPPCRSFHSKADECMGPLWSGACKQKRGTCPPKWGKHYGYESNTINIFTIFFFGMKIQLFLSLWLMP